MTEDRLTIELIAKSIVDIASNGGQPALAEKANKDFSGALTEYKEKLESGIYGFNPILSLQNVYQEASKVAKKGDSEKDQNAASNLEKVSRALFDAWNRGTAFNRDSLSRKLYKGQTLIEKTIEETKLTFEEKLPRDLGGRGSNSDFKGTSQIIP